MGDITKNFSMDELIHSDTANLKGISNKPNDKEKEGLRQLAIMVLQPMRYKINECLNITSGFRCKVLNDYIGGVSNSQHVEGLAADVVNDDYGELYKLFLWAKDNLSYDQLIFEEKVRKDESLSFWIHVSFVGIGENRKEALRYKNGKYRNIK